MLIHLQLDGELAGVDASALHDHLEQCAGCRALYEKLSLVGAALREGLAAQEPSAAFTREVGARSARAQRARPPLATWLPAAAALLIVLIGALVGVPMLRHGAPAAPAIVVSGGDSIHVFEPDQKIAQPGRTGSALSDESVAWGLGGSTIALQFAGGARIDLSEEAVVRVHQNSLDLFKGDLRADLTDAREPFAVATPWGEIRARGAAFTLRAVSGGDAAKLTVITGTVTVTGLGGPRAVSAGESLQLRPQPNRTFAL